MDHAAHVHVSLVDHEGEAASALNPLFEDRSDMPLERIDQLGHAEAGGRCGRHRSANFHRPVATASTRFPATMSAERKIMLRVLRVTRTRASTISPSFPGPTKSQVSATVLRA